MKINTKHIDEKIAYMDSVINDDQMSERTQLYALEKKTLLLQEKAELMQKQMLTTMNGMQLPRYGKVGNQYVY